jgi:hypothetical protein
MVAGSPNLLEAFSSENFTKRMDAEKWPKTKKIEAVGRDDARDDATGD